MAASNLSVASAGGRGRRGRRRPVMSDINVTPFVDVMLVLLIVFMVSAPLLTVGVPLDLPQSQAKALQQNNEPLTVSVTVDGQVFPAEGADPARRPDPEAEGDHRCPWRQCSTSSIYVRGDKKVDYGTMMRVMGRISGAGYHKVALMTEVEQSGQ